MKINKKILCIPPYISTPWSNVTSLHMNDQVLVVTLADGKQIGVPGLDLSELALIFDMHATVVEESQNVVMEKMMRLSENPFRLGFSTLDGLGMPIQHDPSQSNSPDLPKEVLEKISTIGKVLSPDKGLMAAQAVPDCNCVHCQITKALNGLTSNDINISPFHEEEINPEELSFQDWEIVQTGEKMYTVSSKLDRLEKYNVYLGHPVGCTCGQASCEHILAVLKS